MVFDEASSGLKRDRNRLIMEVLAVPAPPTSRDACEQKHRTQNQREGAEYNESERATKVILLTSHWNTITSA